MAHSKIVFRAAAREKILSGATQLADAVRVTLGPKSKSVLIQNSWGNPTVCNDGVTIAKRINLLDPEENLGAQMLRQAAERTGEAVGDGTSTSTVLAHAILADGIRNVVAGASAIDLKRGLDRGLALVIAALAAQSRPVSTPREKAQVATLSAHNDSVIGQLVADALEKVGVEGVVSVEESKTTETVVEVMEGMRFDRGYVSPYFVTDAEKMQVEFEDAWLLLCDHKIGILKDLLPLLEQVAKSGQPLVLIADDIEGEALSTLVVNHIRGVLKAVAIKAPGFGDRRKDMLQDMAVLTGATVVSTELGIDLEQVELKQLGRAHRVVVQKDSTALIGGAGTREAIDARLQQIRAQMATTTSDYDREKLQERLARLAGGVAVIRVGAPSEAEMKARKDALDDAISATRAAITEGIVPGGGLALLKAVPAIVAEEARQEGDVRTGLQILRRALEAPTRLIAENSAVDAGVVVARMLAEPGNTGFDASTNTYVDLYEAGIIDPTKVVRIALENAVSVASILLLTEASITDIPEPPAPAPSPYPEG
ncbi:chaperonin GroEL [Pseudomonas extremaustralis]|jgi:chaperonin GroEL|uniref:Chaperonin GroEL n=1 Tax=Pseudomonas extremaustralis TaxID=359110 RepID=A0A5C5QP91_9PSED|nr:chaperonin GroEL [Pseudomonas extremaustralis]EZI30113.1 molecular chaperone GroEL [Pseudomonas extremaustralis 14-3 substr. 14-3b]MDF3133257.1 chaperonin GroEL [Pseudomonas extremaustralis]MDG2965571.1 chaperonin GroEL [Pseudomonas extremaustralis]TWS07400.1 chaperonin GroEL [Pseudomonas extremaustralis]UUJ40761.1 chaperonin GroEL [Pseudomonas extremaustralis]